MEPIAIIGMGCRFPRANGPDEFWQLLHDGVDAISEVPPDRWDADELYDADASAPGKMITRWGGFVDDVDRFDREFFGISPREASAIDPQQRLLLEVTWEALEDAGQVAEALAGTDTGVFVGVSSYDYALLQASRLDSIDAYWGTGVALSVTANRISYALDLRGPSLAVDTACSSSLVALHTACQSLWSGQSRLAIAGGVNMILSPAFGINFTKAGVMAPDGRCKTFDADADGYVRGEGAGVVVLKPLERALADHDPIRAVIRGGAVGQDGRTNGLMAPNGRSQEDLLRAAHRHSGVASGDIDYVEAHGTGTLLGDMMEAQALGNVVGQDRPPERPCVIGSVKSNIGHLEAAAGIAGVIKTALMLEHRQIPASLHVQNLNPRIDFDSLRLAVARSPMPWPEHEGPVRMGVSSFGFGGTGAHLVFEEAPPERADTGRDRPHTDKAVLLPLSARGPEALRQTAGRHLDMLTRDGAAHADLADHAYTAANRRSHHADRLALVTGSRAGAAEQLRAFLAGDPSPGLISGDTSGRRGRRLAFVCPGQGPIWWPLDPALRDEPALLATLEECDRLIRAEAGWSLLEQLWADPGTSRLAEADYCQPALFALQVALANMWRSWGIVPDAVVGHSMGEVAAAYLSGALGLADAVSVICHRGRVIRTVSGQGRMAVVELPAAAVREELSGLESRVAVAAVNASTSTVISGDPDAVEEVTARLEARDVFCRVLRSVDFASHSPQMEPLMGELAGALSALRPAAPRLPMYSTVTGKRVDDGALDGGYWAQNIRTPVLFAPAVDALLDDGHDVFVELSPHPQLLPAIAQGAQAQDRQITLVPSLRHDAPPREIMLTSLGALYSVGFEPDWTALYPGPRRPVRLPAYPWQRDRSWLPSGPAAHLPVRTDGHPLLGRHLQLAGASGSHVWESAVSVAAQRVLDDHRVQGVAVLPGAAWIEMARAAAAETSSSSTCVLTGVEFPRMLALDDADTATLQLRVSAAADGGASLHAYARPTDDTGREPAWTLHMTGTITSDAPTAADLPVLDLDAVRTRCPNVGEPAGLYHAMEARGLEYGQAFRAVDQLRLGDREAVAAVTATAEVAFETSSYGIHPVFLDAALQVLTAASQGDTDDNDGRLAVPLAVDRVVARPVGAGKQDRLWAHATVRPGDEAGADGIVGDVRLADDDGTTVAVLEGVHIRLLEPDRLPASTALDRALYEVNWQPQERVDAPPKAPTGGWLIFADGRGVGSALAARLAADGERTVLVTPGEAYDDSDPDQLVIRPDDGASVRRAVDAARERMGALRGVAHLWSLDAVADPAPAALGDAQQRGVAHVLHLVHALADGAGAGAGTRLWLLTGGVHGIDGSSPVSVTHAPLWGLGRVAALEHAELRPTLVDLGSAAGPALAPWIADELRADGPETQVAVRDGVRHVARLVRRAAPRSVPAHAVRQDATYLVTGGLGALGLLVARWLVEQGARHLVLLGRRDPGDDAERELRELREAGAEIRVARADVSDETALAHVLADTAAHLPPVRGVVHAAGVLDDATLQTLDPARLLGVFAPKVTGAWNLHTLTADLPLDFFVMFSSLAGVLGSPGQGNYAAANTFLDALAALRAAQGRPALSIAWGPWQDTGLAVRPEGVGRFVERAGIRGIAPATGIGWLGQLLGVQAAQVTVALVDWRRWSAAAVGSPLTTELVADAGATPDAADAGTHRGTLTVDALFAAAPADRQGLLESYLHGAIARSLGMKPQQLDLDRPLTDVGLDSLVAVGMKNQVEVELGLSLPLAAALEGSSVRQLGRRMLADAAAGTTTGTAPPPDDGTDAQSWEEFEIL